MRPIDPKHPLAPSIEAFRAALARRREGKN
jgi:hypothetical protein